ncbi:L,D-transpeptidase [Pectobacterium atrosepticum]|uniref:L,D-transpeptidase n=1 Tax=Pectobacterium atrosepticum TaxID=29471 RepID=UPI0003A8CA66|nr:L,D-transpeptidase [Pectobacterium atrosepticum]GKV85128.1 L,D-transpeptidase [Pectobacterium carotovorum subsp. carotovorum]AIA71347.1 murein L,D-transpeptidase [Pectobacterium atrosepticum]AIK13833.1 putative exported protein [Pectobacterium atrosepticum]ATY90670.1 L,D-transpeptidase [Pectobacterium atrosepticum]MBL0896204.1 L,D-transpeptidase [Pectobacterium atrosepticum]
MLLLHKRKMVRLLLRVGCIWVGSLSPSFSVLAASPTVTSGLSQSSGVVSVENSRAGLLAALPHGMTVHYLSDLSSLYAQHQMQPMWADNRAVQQFQQQLAELAIAGIQPQFTTWVTWLTDPQLTGFARDVVLSDAMLGYLQFVSGVERSGNDWLYSSVPYRLQSPAANIVAQWQQAVKSGTSAAYVVSLAPQHSQYAKMHEALRTMLTDNRPWPSLNLTESLRPEQQSQGLTVLREILQRTGMLSSTENITLFNENTAATTTSLTGQAPVVDGVTNADDRYTGELVDAVKRFQHWQGLEDDGVIGKRTRDWLNVSPQMRATLLALNIQRLRLLPDNVHTGIMVNIPNYSLIYYQDGAERLSSRVIVGQPKRKTPLMSSSLYNVVVNPPWNVPTTLIRQDIIPKVVRDPGYLARHGYTVLSGWSQDAEVIDPSMIDWQVVSPERFPYRLRQAPGANNSLGRYKFNMPNSEAIYLHDTPNHNLFQRDIRALSSGCVRVNKASELASMLLQDAGWNNNRISSTLDQGNTTFVSMKHRIPVNLYYLTAWVAEDGRPQFRTDIYNYDDTARAGTKVLSRAGLLLQ